MADSIGQAYVQILPTTKGFSSKLSSELGGGGGGSALEGAGKKMGGKLIAGIAAAGVGVAAVKGISESIKAGGDLEQSLGGVEAIFGKSADKVKKNAANSFKTVGMSANDYMQNVTSFSASLLQGLNGDTNKAASYADMAMKDMGDNANRFGTDIESIQNAYQGFAKGNFTMLDNLKLGYGGTKGEMLRLVQETGVVDESVKSLDNVTFDQMIEGIHRVQEGLNVTGTTAKEASTTIQGSLASFKAIGEDLLGNLAIGADITPQISALLETASTFLSENLLPMISNVIIGVANNAGQLAGVISTLLQSIIQQLIALAPQLIQGAMTLLTQLASSLPTLLPMLITAAMEIITMLARGLTENAPLLITSIVQAISEMALALTEPGTLSELIMAGVDLLVALVDGLDKAIPVLVRSLPTIITNIVTTLIKLAPKLIPVAVRLIVQLGTGLIQNIPTLLVMAARLIQELIASFGKVDWAKLGKDIIGGIKKGLEEAKQKLINKIKEIADLLPEPVKKVLKISSPSKVFADIAKWIPIGMAVGIEKNAHYVDSAVEGMVGKYAMISSRGMTMDITTRDNTSANSFAGLYNAVKEGASAAQPVVILNGRVLSRELKGMGVSFA